MSIYWTMNADLLGGGYVYRFSGTREAFIDWMREHNSRLNEVPVACLRKLGVSLSELNVFGQAYIHPRPKEEVKWA